MAHKMCLPTNNMPMSSQIKTGYPMHTRRPKPHINFLATISLTHTVQFIEFTYYHDRFPEQALIHKHTNYDLLINNIQNQGWKTNPLNTFTTSVRGVVHEQSINKLTHLKIPKSSIKTLMKNIHQNATKYLTYLVLNKSKLESKQATITPPLKQRGLKTKS